LSLATYLSEQGLVLRRAGKDPRTGKFEFVLEDPRGDAESLKVEWFGSCCRDFEQSLKSMKALLHSGGANGNGRH
jgi:hypothetical protein